MTVRGNFHTDWKIFLYTTRVNDVHKIDITYTVEIQWLEDGDHGDLF